MNMADSTELGLAVKATLDSGGYVSDEITNALVRDRLAQPDAADGFLLDGYPRTSAQVVELDEMLAESGCALDAVVELCVDQDEIVQRLVMRAQTSGRSDDTEEVIRRRQQLYQEQTAPLVQLYRERGLLVQVDGLGEIDAVGERLIESLDTVLAGRAAR